MDHPELAKCDCKNKGDMKCNCEQTLTISHNGGHAVGWGKWLLNAAKGQDNDLAQGALDQAAEEAWKMCDEPIPGGGGGGKSLCPSCNKASTSFVISSGSKPTR